MLSPPDDLLPHPSELRDEMWMREAMIEALKAWAKDEVPVGAVLVKDETVVARSHNTRELSQRPTDHAEVNVIEWAAQSLKSWRLENCTLYVTLEPCVMCSGAILHARVPRVVWGADDPKAGGVRSLYELLSDPRQNHRCELLGGVYGEACGELLRRFFKMKRLEAKVFGASSRGANLPKVPPS